MKGRQTWHVSNNSGQKPPIFQLAIWNVCQASSPSRPWFLDGSDAHWNLEDLASTSQTNPNSEVFWIANRFEQFYEKDAMDIYGSGHWHVIRIGNATSRTNWIKPQGITGAGWSCVEFFTDLYWPKMVVIWSQSYWIIIGWIPETIGSFGFIPARPLFR
jgi:hypothetical protein